jgi:hypothetical protein
MYVFVCGVGVSDRPEGVLRRMTWWSDRIVAVGERSGKLVVLPAEQLHGDGGQDQVRHKHAQEHVKDEHARAERFFLRPGTEGAHPCERLALHVSRFSMLTTRSLTGLMPMMTR